MCFSFFHVSRRHTICSHSSFANFPRSKHLAATLCVVIFSAGTHLHVFVFSVMAVLPTTTYHT